MNSKVTYLSSRSLAAYETMQIEAFVRQHKRDTLFMRLRLLAIWTGFTAMAAVTLLIPVIVQEFLRANVY